jgi:hypothetical protein
MAAYFGPHFIGVVVAAVGISLVVTAVVKR